MNETLRGETIDRAIQVFDSIRQAIERENRPPTIRELMTANGMKSTSTVTHYLNMLRKWGWVDWLPSSQGTLHITRVSERIHIVRRARRKVKSDVA